MASLPCPLLSRASKNCLQPLVTRLVVPASIWALGVTLGVTLGVDPGGCKLSEGFLFERSWRHLSGFDKSRWLHPLPVWLLPTLCHTVILPKMSCAEPEARPHRSASSQKSRRLRGQWGWGLSGRALATVVPQCFSCECLALLSIVLQPSCHFLQEVFSDYLCHHPRGQEAC